MPVHELKAASLNSRKNRKIMGRCLKRHLVHHGEDFAGFAMVTWGHRAQSHTSFLTSEGPVGQDMMPSYVERQLSMHVTALVVKDSTLSTVTPDDPA